MASVDAKQVLALSANSTHVSGDQGVALLSSSGHIKIASQSNSSVGLDSEEIQLRSASGGVALMSSN